MSDNVLQYFMDDSGVYTVSVDHPVRGHLVCDCAEFLKNVKTKKCKHTQWVSSRLDKNGVYTIRLVDAAPDEELEKAAHGTLEDQRQLLLKYGEVIVL